MEAIEIHAEGWEEPLTYAVDTTTADTEPQYVTVDVIPTFKLDGVELSDEEAQAMILNQMCADVHEANRKWWTDLETGEYPIKRNIGELLALVHSEISEALEGARKNLPDDKLPHRPMLEVELADAIIRIFDIAAGFNLDLGGAYVEKMAFNATRADHSLEARKGAHGKKF